MAFLRPKKCFSLSNDGLSFEDELFMLGGVDDPWIHDGIENYPEGTVYFQTNGKEYRKDVLNSNPAMKDFVLKVNGNAGSACLCPNKFVPFRRKDTTDANIALVDGKLPFLKNDGSAANISLI